MEINKCGEAEAKKELERIKQDNQITGQDIDWTESEEDEEANDEVPESGGDDVDESSGESTGGRAD